jgi:hypothetical protein
MLKQKQAEPVKSSLYSKNLKSSLVGKFIKSKLYLLILLTVTTGGIFIGNSMVPEQIPPAQAENWAPVPIFIIFKGTADEKLVRIRPGQSVQFFCDAPSYSSPGEHTIEIGNIVKKVSYNSPLRLSFPPVTRRYLYFIDGVEHYIEVR